MSTQEVVIMGVGVMGPVMSSMVLWLRLYFQWRGARERRFLLNAATGLPAGSLLQVHRDDGTLVVLVVGAARQNEGQR